jgi:hypothetical protein
VAGAAALGAKPVEIVARVKAMAMEANLILVVFAPNKSLVLESGECWS